MDTELVFGARVPCIIYFISGSYRTQGCHRTMSAPDVKKLFVA